MVTSVPKLLLIIVVTVCAVGCGEALETDNASDERRTTGGKADIYGEDDRVETYVGVAGPRSAKMARASAVLTKNGRLVENFDADGHLVGYRLSSSVRSVGETKGLCEGERFFDQPKVGFCSATLVAPDLIATSGHCLVDVEGTTEQARCRDIQIVFGFGYTSEDDDSFDVFNNIPADDVYGCERVEALENVNNPLDHDWALVRLDRPVTGREPVSVQSTPANYGAPILQFGHPSGMPQKIVRGSVGFDRFYAADLRWSTSFIREVDSMGGNSGGGVFDLATNALVGIPSTSSGKDYVIDEERLCQVAGVCGENTTCVHPPTAYGTFDMIQRLRDVRPELLDELDIVEGDIDPARSSILADLFITEYIEGTGWNKALEIYNPSEHEVDAVHCSISIFTDGAESPTASFPLKNIIGPEQTYVICDSRSDIEHSLCDDRVGLGFDGNDAIQLECGGIAMDIFGEIGVNPGEEWPYEDAGTKDHTLRRGCNFEFGSDDFFVWEWTPHEVDDFSDLGRHSTKDCPALGLDDVWDGNSDG